MATQMYINAATGQLAASVLTVRCRYQALQGEIFNNAIAYEENRTAWAQYRAMARLLEYELTASLAQLDHQLEKGPFYAGWDALPPEQLDRLAALVDPLQLPNPDFVMCG